MMKPGNATMACSSWLAQYRSGETEIRTSVSPITTYRNLIGNGVQAHGRCSGKTKGGQINHAQRQDCPQKELGMVAGSRTATHCLTAQKSVTECSELLRTVEEDNVQDL